MMISVVIPLYNKRSSIASTVESVLGQTYADFELIVVDDGSTDGSAEVVKAYSDSRIKLISKNNGGVSSARNAGILTALSNYVAFLDADDIWNPEYLAEINRMISDFPEAGIFGTSYTIVRGGKSSAGQVSVPEGFYGIIDNSDWRYGHLPWTSVVCCRKSALMEVGLFDERMAYGEDSDVWWRIMLKYPFAYSGKCLAIYRKDGENRAMEKSIDLTKLYIFYFEKYSEARARNDAFRHFIDKECMWWLYPYVLADPMNKDAKRILAQIDFSEYKFSFWFRFHFPKIYSIIRKR